ncbi:MAG TPA: permease [Candidatus Eisenbacteria bacterium]
MHLSATLAPMGRVFLDATVEIVPFFLLAIFLGALIEEFVSQRTIERFLTGGRPATMLLASTTGALIPLCTCGMVPLAVSLRRRGSDLKHTFAFLTAGAAVSVPVLFLTWKVLGGRWALIRLLASVLYGLAVGYASLWGLRRVEARSAAPAGGGATAARGGPGTDAEGAPEGAPEGVSEIRTRSRAASVLRRFWGQIQEYFPWVIVSMAIAAVVDVLVPRHWIDVLYGERTAFGALVGALSGVPFYFCSGAELPLVKELLAKGMGSGPAASMMLAVPIVNILTFGVVGRWLGTRGAATYLLLCVAGAAALGALYGWFAR